MNLKFYSLTCLLSFLTLVSAFNNPVIWEDLADLDIKRVDNAYYYSASTMHYSPGAPILRSYDLFNWEYIGHSVPTLDFGDEYSLIGSRAYVKGIWASFFNYNPVTKLWYWGGCIHDGKSYIYSASSVTGPWSRHATFDKVRFDPIGYYIIKPRQ
jgi:beta-xylosidase